jgi:heavy metal translocating P-type ATPase
MKPYDTAGRASRETWIALFALAAIALHLALRYAVHAPRGAALLPLWAILLLGGLPLLADLARKLLRLEFGSDLLAGISILTAVLLGEYLVGAIVVLMLSGGVALEQYATRRVSSALDALAHRMPRLGHRKTASGLIDAPLEEISAGETLVVLPHEICPVDGNVIEGHGIMDESYLTGEPFQIRKTPGSEVLSGAINGETALTILSTRRPVDSRYARIMQVMEQTGRNRPPMRRLGDMLGAWYTPLAVAVAAGAWLWSGSALRFLAVIVIATPCPLLIAIPVAIIGAISISARRGIVIKNPAALEQIDRCRTLIFDKTGTLTYGKPALVEIVCAPGFEDADVLRAAASLESYSRHPLSHAVLEAASKRNLEEVPVAHISEKPGEGLTGVVGGRQIRLTGRRGLASAKLLSPALLPALAPGLECLVVIDDRYAATLRFRDEPRAEGISFIAHLKPRHSVRKVMLVSGDREIEARHLAGQVGITEVHSAKSPEEKVAIVAAEAQREKTLYVGDGINDAPAMLAATIGVAFGSNSDITAEAADAVILEASLAKVDELIHIGGRMRTIALQSAVGGMALSLVGMMAAAAGYLPPLAGAMAQEIIDLAAVLNAVRVALPFDGMTDFQEVK